MTLWIVYEDWFIGDHRFLGARIAPDLQTACEMLGVRGPADRGPLEATVTGESYSLDVLLQDARTD